VSIADQIEALGNLAQNDVPGVGTDTIKADIDAFIEKVLAVTGPIAGTESIRGLGEQAKIRLDDAAAAIAQIGLEVASLAGTLAAATGSG
jgi:hypothetical protein